MNIFNKLKYITPSILKVASESCDLPERISRIMTCGVIYNNFYPSIIALIMIMIDTSIKIFGSKKSWFLKFLQDSQVIGFLKIRIILGLLPLFIKISNLNYLEIVYALIFTVIFTSVDIYEYKTTKSRLLFVKKQISEMKFLPVAIFLGVLPQNPVLVCGIVFSERCYHLIQALISNSESYFRIEKTFDILFGLIFGFISILSYIYLRFSQVLNNFEPLAHTYINLFISALLLKTIKNICSIISFFYFRYQKPSSNSLTTKTCMIKSVETVQKKKNEKETKKPVHLNNKRMKEIQKRKVKVKRNRKKFIVFTKEKLNWGEKLNNCPENQVKRKSGIQKSIVKGNGKNNLESKVISRKMRKQRRTFRRGFNGKDGLNNFDNKK